MKLLSRTISQQSDINCCSLRPVRLQSHLAVRLGTRNHGSLKTVFNFLNQPVAPVSCDAAAEYIPAVASDAPLVTSAVPAACGSLRLHDSQMPATLEVSVKICG